jgi:hypothetical protein
MTCITCKHWSPKKSGPMASRGYANCALKNLWNYFAPTHTCAKHARAEDATIQARQIWIDRLDGKK